MVIGEDGCKIFQSDYAVFDRGWHALNARSAGGKIYWPRIVSSELAAIACIWTSYLITHMRSYQCMRHKWHTNAMSIHYFETSLMAASMGRMR